MYRSWKNAHRCTTKDLSADEGVLGRVRGQGFAVRARRERECGRGRGLNGHEFGLTARSTLPPKID